MVMCESCKAEEAEQTCSKCGRAVGKKCWNDKSKMCSGCSGGMK